MADTQRIQLDQSQDAFTQAMASHSKAGSTKDGKKAGKMRKVVAIVLSVFVIILLLCGAVGFFAFTKVQAMRSKVEKATTTAREAYDAIKTQNLPVAEEKLTQLEQDARGIQSDVQQFAFLKAFPIVSSYYKDSEHGFTAGYAAIAAAKRTINEIEPYADVLGLKGQGSFTGGSAEERIAKLLETLSKVTPALDEISKDLKVVEEELAAIDEQRYPETFKDKQIRSKISQAKSITKEAYLTLTEKRQAFEVLPDMAGASKRKKYLVLFQNSGELRPTGGFLTAYAVINVDKGKVEAEGSGDIYELDQRFTNKPPIPPILKRFLTTESKWNLRDMNLSPDFKDSMNTFNKYYQTIKSQKTEFDGIIAVDTHFLESLLKVLGPVEVPGYGTFTAENDKRCDCPQIIYALSEIIDRPTNYIRENRKGILGPMMKSILTKTYTAPKNVWPLIFQTGWQNIESKHIQFYFYDEKLQAAAESIDAAGRIKQTPANADYLTIVDTNLAGAKSNFFVTSEVQQEVEIPQGGTVKKTVSVTYKNPFKASNCNLEAGQLCLNGVLQDWVRFYLPEGAKMISSRGFDDGSVQESTDLGHAVIEGTFRLQPLSQAKIEIIYTIPYTDTKTYTLFMQKQGGTENVTHTLVVNGEEHELILDKDKKVSFGF